MGQEDHPRSPGPSLFGYLLEPEHGPAYRLFCVVLAFLAAWVMGALWWDSLPPKPPVVYHYQWPGQFGDQQMTICLSKNEHGGPCERDYISDEL